MPSNLISLLQPIQIQFLSAVSIAKLAILSAIHHCLYEFWEIQGMLNNISWEFKGQILHYNEFDFGYAGKCQTYCKYTI